MVLAGFAWRVATGARTCDRREGIMSVYTRICDICLANGEKRWILPGTEQAATPRHHSGARGAAAEAEQAAYDADHPAEPVDFRLAVPQRALLTEALLRIRAEAPEVVLVDLETSDQDTYGFVLRGLRLAGGTDAGVTPEDLDGDGEVSDFIGDLDWDGVVGEDSRGYATIDLREYVF
jgi:hypothetical protein